MDFLISLDVRGFSLIILYFQFIYQYFILELRLIEYGLTSNKYITDNPSSVADQLLIKLSYHHIQRINLKFFQINYFQTDRLDQ